MTRQEEFIQMVRISKDQADELFERCLSNMLEYGSKEIDDMEPCYLSKLFTAAFSNFLWSYSKPMGRNFDVFKLDVDKIKKVIW